MPFALQRDIVSQLPLSDGSTSSANSTFFSPPRELALTLLRLRAQLKGLARFLLPILLLVPGMAQAQTTEQPSADIQQRERIEQQLKELRDQQQALLNSMQQQVADFNARIAAMEAELGVTPSKDQAAQANSGAESSGSASGLCTGCTRPNESR